MSVKSFVRRYVVPPAIAEIIKPQQRYGAWGRYDSWQDAVRASKPKGDSFNSFDIVERELDEVLLERADAPCFNSLHLAAGLSLPTPLKVLDFGGGVGVAFAKARQIIPERIAWWRIVDLPEVVNRRNKLADDNRISFHTTIAEAIADGRPNFITCSSVLQFMEDPYPTLDKLFSIGAEHIVLDRLPLDERERFSVFHATSGYSVPWRILSRERLNIASRGYEIFYQETMPKHPTAPDAGNEYCLFYKRPTV